MIKRRFYKLERGDKESGSDSSSFSSDSEVEEASGESREESEDDAITEASGDDSDMRLKSEDETSSISSGLANDDDAEADDDAGSREDEGSPFDTNLSLKHGLEKPETESNATDGKELVQDIPDCMIKCKSVFKCRFCPNIICLNEDTMRAHVGSKRHARSEKLAKEGKLKAILNSKGEVEEQEIAEEIHASDNAHAQDKQKSGSKRSKRQRKSLKRREKKSIEHGETEAVKQRPIKKGRKTSGETEVVKQRPIKKSRKTKD